MLVIGSTVYNISTFLEINRDGFFHVPEDCQHDLLFWPLRSELILYWRVSMFLLHRLSFFDWWWLSHVSSTFMYACIYIYIYIYIYHHVVPPARISLTLSLPFSLSFIASGRSSRLHPVSSHSCCMYIRAGRPPFVRPYVGIHRSTSLMSSSLLLQQCPASLVRLTGLVQYCTQHSCVIAV